MAQSKFNVKHGLTVNGLDIIDSSGNVTIPGTLSINGVAGATETYVDNAIETVIGTVSDNLDTLQELAAAIDNDPNFFTTVSDSIDLKLNSADFDTTADTWLTGKTTTNLTEGDNLYYTDARVQTKLGSVSGNIVPDTDVTYDLGSATNRFRDLYLSGNSINLGGIVLSNASGTLEVTDGSSNIVPISLDSNTTDDLSEGSNLYYTDNRALTAIGEQTYDITGFPNRTDTTLSWDPNNLLFTLAPTGASFTLWYRGEEITITGSKTLTITDSSGGRYIQYNPSTGELEEGDINGHLSILGDLLVAYIWWDADNQNTLVFGDERHASHRDTQWHLSQHLDVGAVWRSGGAVSYTLQNDASVGIAFGAPIVFADEDVVHTITHSASPSNPYEQTLEGTASIPTIYLDGTSYVQTSPSTLPWIGGTNRAYYNQVTGGVGSLVEADSGTYMIYWIVATNDSLNPVKAVMGKLDHAQLSDAEAETFDNYGLPMPELVPMYKVVLSVNDANTANTSKVEIEGVYQLRSRESSLSAGFSATSHNALTERGANDQHPISAITGLQTSLNSKLNQTQVLNSISVTDLGGDGSLTYNSGSGVITYTGPSATEVRAHFSAGTGVTISAGEVSIGQDVSPTADVTFNTVSTTGNAFIGGDLTVSGTTITNNTTTISTENPLVILNDNPSTEVDVGVVGKYLEGGTTYSTGLFRDATDNVWKLFDGYTPSITDSSIIDVGDASYALASIQASEFIGAMNWSNVTNRPDPTITVELTGTVNGTANHTFTDLANGTISLSTSIPSNTVLTLGGLTINGDLNVQGTTTTVNQTTLTVTDSKIFLADANPSDAIDGGVFINYNNGSADRTAGFFRDADDGKFKFFSSYLDSDNVSTTINTGDATYSGGTIVATLEGDVTGNVTGQVSDISNHTSDDLPEGSTNLYFTNEKVDDRVAALLNAGTNIQLSYLDGSDTLEIAHTTSGVTAGSYGSSAAVPVITVDAQGHITALSTTAVAGVDSVSYDSATGVLTIATSDASEYTTDLGIGSDDSPTFANITTSGYLRGPAEFVIDPSAYNDITGKVVILGDLQVDGTTTTINSTTLTIDDKNIVLASGAVDSTAADGAGITVDGAGATFNYSHVGAKWVSNRSIETSGQFISTLATGTAPISVSSTTLVSNLNSDLLDGQEGSYYLDYTNFTNVPTNVSDFTNDAGYLTSFTETDPVFVASEAYNITSTDTTNWDTAYGWGDHSSAGYLTSYTETDPIFVASEAYNITSTDTTNWDTAYSWGDHAQAGYITSYINTEYNHLAVTTTGGALLRLSGTDSSNDDVKFASGTNVTVAYTDDNTITISSTDTNTTYSAGTGLTLNGTAFDHTNSVTAATASEGGSTRTLDFGGTFNVPSVTYDAQGHVTSKGSVTLTLPANPNTNTTYSHSAVTTTGGAFLRLTGSDSTNDDVKLASGTNVTVAYTDANTITISSTDTNTTYSAGNGISLSGTTFSVAAGSGLTQEASGLAHSDTSTQASVDNSNGTVIQDITLDGFGHITAIGSVDLDGRYYTETEADSRFVNATGDTMSGQLIVGSTDGQSLVIRNDTSAAEQSSYISFSNKNGTGTYRPSARISGYNADNAYDGDLLIETYASGTPYKGLRVDENSNVWFYNTSEVAKFQWDASNSRILVDGNLVWHAGNDGSGSGLDADLLDGQQGSYYYAASNPNGYQTAAQVSAAISSLVDSAPTTLDTLNELAAALGDDPNFATTVTNSIATKLSLTGGTLTGQVIFPGTQGSTTPVLPSGFISRNDSSDGNHDIWGISEAYYPSHATAANAWGIQWNGDSNQIRFIGNGTQRLVVDLDGGSTGALTWEGNTIWHAGNDGSGSGLDADLLDGQHASDFAAASHSHSYLPLTGGTITGYLTVAASDAQILLSDETGSPANQKIRLRHEPINSNNPGSEDNALWIEDASGNSLPCALVVEDDIYAMGSSKVWHAGNDGSGSGLDADLLDGQHASSFASSSHTHSYLPLSGGTMTGDLTISKADAKIRLYDSTGTSGNNPAVEWDTTANQGISLSLNVYDGELPQAGYGMVFGPSTTNTQWPSTGNLSVSVLGEIYAGSEDLSTVNLVWHAGNDGSGSGLDADLLDGQHGSYYAPASHTHSYLPLSGGTMTGTISNNDVSRYWLNTATNWGIYWDTTNNKLQFHGAGTNRFEVDLDNGYGWFGGELTTGGDIYSGGGQVFVATGDARVKYGLWGDNGTTYGIGMSSSYTYGGLADYATSFQMDTTANRGWWWGTTSHTNAQGAMSLTIDGRATIASGMRIGFGQSDTTSPTAGEVTINGLLTATQKSFTIDHPTKPGMKLRYGSLEGPENGVYVRGRLKGTNIIELPEYWTKLVDPDSITVQLTSMGRFQKLYVKEIADNKVVIGNGSWFSNNTDCFYIVHAERVDVDKLEVEIY